MLEGVSISYAIEKIIFSWQYSMCKPYTQTQTQKSILVNFSYTQQQNLWFMQMFKEDGEKNFKFQLSRQASYL